MLKELLEVQEEMQVIKARLADLQDMAEPETEDEVARSAELDKRNTEVDDLIGRWDALKDREAPLIERSNRLDEVKAYALNAARTEPGDGARYLGGRGPSFIKQTDPFDTDPLALNKPDVIARASVVIERERHVPVSDANKEHLDNLIHRSEAVSGIPGYQFDGSYIARRILFTENPLYRSAFAKYIRDGSNAVYTAEEGRAVATFREWEISRAASENTTTAGGFGVPVKLAA